MNWRESRDGKTTIRMHPGQARAWRSEKRFVLVLAGTQGGKTSFGPIWLTREVQRLGPGDHLASSANYDLLRLKMLPELRLQFERTLGWTYMAGDNMLINERDGKRIILRSALRPEGLESSTALSFWGDEWGQNQVDLIAWEAAQRRLAINRGRALMTTTPYNLGWLKTQFYDRWRAGDPDYDVISFRSIENPAFPVEEYERAKRTLPDWRFRMFYDGEFAQPAGLIYHDFDSAKHVERPFRIPSDWPRIVGVDFGLVNTAILWMAEEPVYPSRIHIYREYMGGGLTPGEHARRCLEYNEPVKYWFGGSGSEEGTRLNWQLAGVPMAEPLISGVEDGIAQVIGLIKSDRLRVFDSCLGLLSELATYSRELDAAGDPTEKISDKQTFHRLDALRYGVSCVNLYPKAPAPEEYPDLTERQRASMSLNRKPETKILVDDYA